MGASQSQQQSQVTQRSLHEFTVKDARNREMNLKVFKGKVLLIVNVASKCALGNANYTQLTQLHSRYKDRGFEILAFPCNQFLKKEPGTSQEAESFVCERYKATFPILGKVRVNGPETEPVFRFLKTQKAGSMGSTRIKWNFTKFLVDEDGHVIKRYSPTTPPLALEMDIQKALGLVPKGF
ncbi:hypothetical protein PIB30_012445 [Stylosanthes scabra]|uniref:Glutathione peroxidase n=1 Tax=Stylosanthes scabra TaxID=79078 RepID=A0ABU6S626_9FABA|nr:hypothetical protein [Stylosanthes scabra]